MTTEDTPCIVQWVLDFLNLRSEPGKQNINKQPADVRKKLKCPPLDEAQCSPTLEDFKQFFLKEGIPPEKGTELLLENGQPLESLNTEPKLPETCYTPTYSDYPFELKLYIKIHEELWCRLCEIFGNMVHNTKTYSNEGTAEVSFNHFRKNILEKYIDCLKDDEIPYEDGCSKNRGADFRGIIDVVKDGVSEIDSFPHSGMLPQAIYACILDFSYNHKEILSRLKQCPLCSKFRIQEGGKKIYCSDECRNRFDRPSRDKENTQKKDNRKTKRKNEKPKIIKYIMKNKYEQIYDNKKKIYVYRLVSKERAEGFYEEVKQRSPGNVSSLAEFIRTEGNSWYK
jgi:hypothetical protein